MFVVFILLVMAVQLLIVYVGGGVFRCAGLTARELLLTLALAFTVIPVDLLRKAIFRKGRDREAMKEKKSPKAKRRAFARAQAAGISSEKSAAERESRLRTALPWESPR